MNNKKSGSEFEKRFAKILHEHGWWVHIMAQNAAGQPFDVIAAKDGFTIAVDCKVCENDRFPVSRIEENQQMAMRKWKDSGNGLGWFAFELSDKSIWMLTLPRILSQDKKTLNEKTIRLYGFSLDEFLKLTEEV